MAAAAALTALPVFLNLIQPVVMPFLAKVMDKIFGDKTGSVKQSTLTTIIQTIADNLSGAGQIPGTIDKTSIVTAIEAVVAELNAKGELKGPNTTIILPNNDEISGILMVLDGAMTIIKARQSVK